MKRHLSLIIIAILALSLAACGADDTPEPLATAGDILIEDGWARPPAMPGGNAAAYFTLRNTGDTADRLIAAASALGPTEIHQSIMSDDGVMSMQPVEGVDVPAGATVELLPGGLHLMFIGVADPPAPGDTVTLTLTFQNAGEITIDVPVREQ